jgi:integrase
MPFAEVPAFVTREVAKRTRASRSALIFAILTAARSGEVRHARWEQVNLEAREWTRPASMMKSSVAHVVTLSAAAIALLEGMAEPDTRKGPIFPGTKPGKTLSDMTPMKVLRLADRTETVHGFCSSLRD